jgi:2'-5' RNA ligase
MRLFCAVAADEEVKSAAAAVAARLRAVPGDYRWVDPRDMHVTLRFFGETDPARLPEIESRMKAAAAVTPPFELAYASVGAFDSIEDPRVVWIGIDGGAAPLKALSERLGYDEPRPFSPHLTLGRRRRAPAPPEFAAALRAEPPLSLRRPVEKLSLYASRPAPFGHAYEILAEAPLASS